MAKDSGTPLAAMTDLFDFLTERGVLSALYLASLSYPLVVASQTPGTTTLDHASIAVICTVLGLIISKITYEFLLDYIRPWTEPGMLREFRETVRSSDICPTYRHFRAVRQGILGRDVTPGQQFLNERILKDESLRHTITYLMSANFLALAVLVVLLIMRTASPASLSISFELLVVELCVVVYVLVATLIGDRSRSAALARSVAHAYLALPEAEKLKLHTQDQRAGSISA